MLRKNYGIILFAMILAAVPIFGQSHRYQRGTITSVTPHPLEEGERDGSMQQYDIGLTVGNTRYTVLYAVPRSRDLLSLAPGMDLPVLVEDDTIAFSSKGAGIEQRVPILRRDVLQPRKAAIDWSKTSGEYFTMQFQHFAENLQLDDTQRAKLKSILEQESGEVAQINGNPVLSRKQKLNHYQKIVGSSDKKMRSFLSDTQFQKLGQLRAEQRRELARLADLKQVAKQQ